MNRALRERPADAQHFAKLYPQANGVPPRCAEAKHQLMTARWRGNVRELENTICRC
jgi:DNA-binding NtrC family response regulator